jgi:outer membrane protein assembly factor BamB
MHHLIALDAKTGKVAWVNEKVPEKFGTPVAMTVGGLDILLAPSGHIVRVKDGQILGTIPELQFTSAVINGSIAYFTGPATTALEFSADGTDSVKTRKLWISDLEGTFYASLVFDNGLLFAASNEGNLYVLNAADGKILTTKELEILCSNGKSEKSANLYPSLSIAGRNLFLSNDAGETLVLESGKDYKEIHKNKLPEGSGGTPAFAGGFIFVRDGENLFCLGEK